MLAGITLAAVGLVVFTYAANPPEETKEVAAPPPTPAVAETRIRLSDLGKRELGGRGGVECTTNVVRAVVLSSTATVSEVVTVPTGGCRAMRLKLPTKLGSLADGS